MAAPNRKGNEGEVYVWKNRRGTVKKYYKYSNGAWKQQTGADAKQARQDLLAQNGGNTSFTALGAPGTPTTSLRYPRDAGMASNSDYVLFDFYEYKPPYQGMNKSQTQRAGTPVSAYNRSVTDKEFYERTSQTSVVLYMPEDVSTGYKANWSGKSFSNVASNLLATAGANGFGEGLAGAANTLGEGFAQAVTNIGNKAIRDTISSITGESVSQNDVFGATRGVILNPNVELLFAGTDLRNFQLRYKLVPRNDREASDIKEIMMQFKKAMLPKFASGEEMNLVKGEAIKNGFIKVPNVCRVTFMRGGGPNPDVTQYKMCAITQVDINYTPDGTYATYSDGSMVAIELSLNFQETKLIFAEEVENY